MKIEYVKGDLFATQYTTIMHGCNSKGVMGSGVAKIIKQQFPVAYSAYVKQYETFGLTLGDIQIVSCMTKVIINAITQDSYAYDGKLYASYEGIRSCFEKVNDYFSYDLPSFEPFLALPMIGAGLGGGDWNIIEKIIEETSTNYQPVVYRLE